MPLLGDRGCPKLYQLQTILDLNCLCTHNDKVNDEHDSNYDPDTDSDDSLSSDDSSADDNSSDNNDSLGPDDDNSGPTDDIVPPWLEHWWPTGVALAHANHDDDSVPGLAACAQDEDGNDDSDDDDDGDNHDDDSDDDSDDSDADDDGGDTGNDDGEDDIYIIQNYSEFKLYLNLTRPPEKGDS
jgi:hypothetical protein